MLAGDPDRGYMQVRSSDRLLRAPLCTRVSGVPFALDRTLRIAMVDMPALLGDMLAIVLREDPGLELVARVQSEGDLERALALLESDVVLLGLESDVADEAAAEFLERRRQPQLVGIYTHSGGASIRRLRPERREMHELSPSLLPDMLRECWATGGEPV
jgi:hypothetical protein